VSFFLAKVVLDLVLRRKRKGRETRKCSTLGYTAKTKCRKFETNIPRKGISGP
jgi:hypothetical protein